MDNKKTFWPIGIALFLSIMVCMIILTIYISIKSSPEDDNAYFSTRQVVDKDINDILQDQNQLEEEYKFYYIDDTGSHKLNQKANKKTSIPIDLKANTPFILNIKITDKNDKNIDSAKVESIITRFATSKFDKNLGELPKNNEIFKSNEILLEKGDWKAMIKITINNKNAFFEQYIKVTE